MPARQADAPPPQAPRPHAADGLRLAEVMCARLCHDLSGLLGTLGGTLELAAEAPDMLAEALLLASETARQLSQRLSLLRAAWAEGGQAQDRDGLVALARGLPGGHRLRLELGGLAEPQPPERARLLLNLLMLAAEALPLGGTVTMAGDDSHVLSVAVDGPRAGWPASLTAALGSAQDPGAEGCAPYLGPRALQAPLSLMLAARQDLLLWLGAPVSAGGPPVLHVGRDGAGQDRASRDSVGQGGG